MSWFCKPESSCLWVLCATDNKRTDYKNSREPQGSASERTA